MTTRLHPRRRAHAVSLSWRSPVSCPSSRSSSGGRGSPPRASCRGWSTRPAARCARRARPATRPGTGTRAPRSTGRSSIDPSTSARCGPRPGCCSASTSSARRARTPSRRSSREPDDWMSWANLTDALVELGDYDRAVEAADRLATLRPGVAAYTRVAGLQALLGDRATRDRHARGRGRRRRARGARDARMDARASRTRAPARSATPPPRAPPTSARSTRSPATIWRSPAWRARAPRRAAPPRPSRSRRARRRARAGAGALRTPRRPPRRRRPTGGIGSRRSTLVRVMERLAAAQGTSYGREVALFLADHDRDLPDALRLARDDVARRPDVYGDDVLAWTLYKNGRPPAAKRAVDARAPARNRGRDVPLSRRHDRPGARPAPRRRPSSRAGACARPGVRRTPGADGACRARRGPEHQAGPRSGGCPP